jgi:hypothetical protein
VALGGTGPVVSGPVSRKLRKRQSCEECLLFGPGPGSTSGLNSFHGTARRNGHHRFGAPDFPQLKHAPPSGPRQGTGPRDEWPRFLLSA